MQTRWQKIEDLFHAVRQQPRELRASFLQNSCPDDELREEIESLLAKDAEVDRPIDRPVWEGATLLLENTPDLYFTVGETIGPYTITGLLGEGGMGQVYRALDSRLDRFVAIKISRDRFSERFQREARAIAALNHPNVCTLYDIGPNYLVMELIEGPTLADRIKEGPVPFPQALKLARQIAAALGAAHEIGMVHRDLKPGNIKVKPDGTVKVLDFGLAKIEKQPTASPDSLPTVHTTASELGVILGTAAYMAPEQARGERVDKRADIWAFGTVFFEMLTGKRLFSGNSVTEILAGVLKEEPDLNLVPSMVRGLIRSCLEKDRGKRLSNIGDVLRLLPNDELKSTHPRSWELWQGTRSKSVGVVAVFVIALIAAIALGVRAWTNAPSAPQSIAVLPFHNLTGNAEGDYLADGFTEELVTQLGRNPFLRTISRTSIMRYKDSGKPLREIANELNVERIVEGSVAHAGTTFKVTAHLIDAKTDQELWAESYDREADNFLTLEADIARVIENEVHTRTTPQTKTKGPANESAYESFLRGRYEYAKRDGAGLRKSIDFFNRAIAADPNYAAAYAGMADSYIALSTVYQPPNEVMPLARQAAEKALALDEGSAESHSALGWINFAYDWKWQEAEAHVRRAIALNPSYAPAHSVYSGLLVHFRREKEAIAEMQVARRLDPLSLSIAYDTVWNMLDARQYDLVLQQAEKTLSTDPDFSFANSVSGLAYALRGVFNEGIPRAKRGANPTDSPVTLGLLGEVYARAGQTKEAEQILEQLQGIAAKTYMCHHDIAALQAILGHKEEALKSLDEAHQAHSDCMAFLLADPRMDPLRGDVRFEKLLQEVEAGR